MGQWFKKLIFHIEEHVYQNQQMSSTSLDNKDKFSVHAYFSDDPSGDVCVWISCHKFHIRIVFLYGL